jgi:hypothetical protein
VRDRARRLPSLLDNPEDPMVIFRAIHLLTIAALFAASSEAGMTAASSSADRTIRVSGSGFDLLNGAIVHSKEPTPTGMIQKSTEIVELKGDLVGKVLYHVTSEFDFVRGTLVNTGEEVYSGTIAGSEPVLIHDDQFRFDVNLATGAESGRVYLFNHIAGPKVRCSLDVVGTGLNADGNPTFDYTGECTFRGPARGSPAAP